MTKFGKLSRGDAIDTMWELVESIGIGMLVT